MQYNKVKDKELFLVKMSMKDFVRRSEQKSKENINRDYMNIDMLYYELDFLNNLLNRYSNKNSGKTLTVFEKQDEMTKIREQIPRVYENINYYKECINAEKKEMKRIYDTYVFDSNQQIQYEKYIEYNKNNSELEEQEELEDLEEIKDYKYNPVTDTWE